MNNVIPIKDNFSGLIQLLAVTMLYVMSSTQGAIAKNSMPSPTPKIKHDVQRVDNNKEVLLRRTSHEVVHVTASGYTGIGYGVGYAYTEDNRCLLAHRIAEVNGRLSEQLGGRCASYKRSA